MKIGIFGGTFDPIHRGHLWAACLCKKRIGLSRIIFVPSFIPPHKQNYFITDFSHRFNMVSMAISSFKYFFVSNIETILPPPSYTINTLNYFRKTYPEDAIYFIVGSDMLKDFSTWHKAEELILNYNIIVILRKGVPLIIDPNLKNNLRKLLEAKIVRIPTLAISSTYIRENIKDSQKIVPLIGRQVYEYILNNRLYSYK